jgi:hypothetical protein
VVIFWSENREFMTAYFSFRKSYNTAKVLQKKKVINATSRAQSSIASSLTDSCDPHPPMRHPLETSYVYDNA